MTNLKDIRKGDTYTFTLEAFSDETETTKIDLSTYSFLLTAKYASGSTAFTRTNTDFVQVDIYTRRVTISKTDTAALNVGELYYQIDVTYPDTTAEQWADGYIKVLA
jgi:Cu/Ag efflux protein CusF